MIRAVQCTAVHCTSHRPKADPPVPSLPSRPFCGLALLLVTALALGSAAGCASGSDSPAQADSAADRVRAPKADAVFDYQLGGPYRPGPDVRAVSRDRSAEPAPGLYNICYVNAFQTQPGQAVRWWEREHPELLLRDGDGELVVDEDWGEPLLDISGRAEREALLDIVGAWVDGCADAGFDAVEPDNLDSYARSDGLLTARDAEAFATLLAERAHQQGLAVAQKNTSDLLGGPAARIGFDFAVVEECARYQECPAFAQEYDDRVFDIEYRAADFDAACRSLGGELSITLRDRDVVPADEKGHLRRHC